MMMTSSSCHASSRRLSNSGDSSTSSDSDNPPDSSSSSASSMKTPSSSSTSSSSASGDSSSPDVLSESGSASLSSESDAGPLCYACASTDRARMRHVNDALKRKIHRPPPAAWLERSGFCFCERNVCIHLPRGCHRCRREEGRRRIRRPRPVPPPPPLPSILLAPPPQSHPVRQRVDGMKGVIAAPCYACDAIAPDIIRHVNTKIRAAAHPTPPSEWVVAQGLLFCAAHRRVSKFRCNLCRWAGPRPSLRAAQSAPPLSTPSVDRKSTPLKSPHH